jgi:hypothetical protein
MSANAALSEQPEVLALSDPAKGHGRRLTQREVAILLQLAEAGKTNTEIAQALKCSLPTVGRTLEQWGDNRALARRFLEANSPKLAKTIVKSKDAATALRTLQKLDVVRDEATSAGAQVVVMIGSSASPLAPPAIEIRPLSPVEISSRGEG